MKKSIITIILICIDQIIKIIIHFFFMDEVHIFNISKFRIGFKPFLNTKQLSMFNNELNMNLSLTVLIAINAAAIALFAALYLYFKRIPNSKKTMLLNCTFCFTMGGAVASIIDKIFWKGSLDYILAFGQISDLKDVYAIIGTVCYILFILFNIDALKNDNKAVK